MAATSDDLRLFLTVIDSGSITAAASQLGQTPSAISRTLSRLEDKLGTTLINRTTRRMTLTEEGHLLLAGARQVLGQLDALSEQLTQRHQQPAGRLRVNAATSFMLHAVVPHLAEFRARYPLIQLELNTDELNIDLIARQTDVAIRIGNLTDSTLHARPLASSRLRLVASPDYVTRHGEPSPATLGEHTLLGFSQLPHLNIWPLRHACGPSLTITPDIRASSGETLRFLVLAGHGVACLAEFLVSHDIAAGRLQVVMAEHTHHECQSIHAVYYRNTQLALRIQCFLDFLQERLRPLTADALAADS